jgi:RNA polymerase sigma-70 factor (ECF subfamily)
VTSIDDFSVFYESVFARLVGQLRVVTGDLEAEDIVQEALARASLRWARLQAYDAPEAWVRRVALNLAADRARRARRRLAALRRLGPPAPTPPVQIEDLALLEALRGLSVGQRQVLVLHYLVGMPPRVRRSIRYPHQRAPSRVPSGWQEQIMKFDPTSSLARRIRQRCPLS